MKSLLVRMICIASALIGTQAFASAFETDIPFGGQTSGVAGIGAANMQGSQALFFNPAGLATDKPNQHDISLNLSPSWPTSKGPVTGDNDSQTSKSALLVPFSLLYGHSINENLGVGVGTYISSGAYADFTDVSVTGFSGTMESKSQIAVTEVAFGAGYKVTDKLKVGAAWRVASVNATFDFLKSVSQTTVANVQLTNLTDTEYSGYKLGAQYKIGDKTDIGLNYRSEVIFNAKGNSTTFAHTSAAVYSGGKDPATLNTLLPAAANLAAEHRYNESFRVLAEYDFTQYSKVSNLGINPSSSYAYPVQLHLKDQHQIRLAGEYKGWSWPVRFGYIWTSQVTNSDYAMAAFTPPGTGNTLTLGTGEGIAIVSTSSGTAEII